MRLFFSLMHRTQFQIIALAVGGLFICMIPQQSQAHEVYVLSPEEVTEAMMMPGDSPLAIIAAHGMEFVLWVFIGIALVTTIFAASIFRPLEKYFDPGLMKLKHY